VTPPAGGVVLTARDTARIIALLRLLSAWLGGSSQAVADDLQEYLRRPGALPPAARLPVTRLRAPGLSGLCADIAAMLCYRQKTGGTP
jgi:hypothetical protein